MGWSSRVVCLGIGIGSAAHAYTRPEFLPSYESHARAYTGVTSPLLPATPDPARLNLGEQSFLSDNVALLAWLPGHDSKISPLDLRARKTGDHYLPHFGVQNAGEQKISTLATNLAGSEGELQSAQTDAGLLYLRKEIGFSLFYEDTQEAILQANQNVFYSRYRDIKTQLGVGTPILDSPTVGRLDFGVEVKFVFRKGDEVTANAASPTAADIGVSDTDSNKISTAGGADLGLLYTLAQRPLGWRVQFGYSWKDIGTTQFFLGPKTQLGKRFESYPNNQTVGLGFGSPLYFRYFRSAVRLEMIDITTPIKAADRFAASWELRFVEAFSLFTGIRGSAPSFGAQFRVPYFEIMLANAPIYSGKSDDYHRFRAWDFSMKAVF